MKDTWKKDIDKIYEIVVSTLDSSSVYFKNNRMARMDFIYFVGFWMTYYVILEKKDSQYGISFEDWYEDHLFSQCGLSKSEIQRFAVSRCASYQDIMLAPDKKNLANKRLELFMCFIHKDMIGDPFGFPNHKVSKRMMGERVPEVLSLFNETLDHVLPHYRSLISSDEIVGYE